MPNNRYDNYISTPWNQMKQFDLPIEMIGQTLQTLQQRSDRNYAEAQQLPGLLKVNSLDPDKAAVNTIVKSYEDRITEMANKANGDYSNLGKDLLSLKQNIAKELQQGTLGAAQQEYNRFQENRKQELERLKKGEIREEDYSLGIQHALNTYKGIGSVDPITGTWNHYTESYAPSFNENKVIEEAMKNLKPEQMHQLGIFKDPNNPGYYRKVGNKIEYLSYDKAQEVIGNYVAFDPDFQRLQQWRAERGGRSLGPQLQNMINARALGASYKKEDKSEDLIWDRMLDYSERVRHNRNMEQQLQRMNEDRSNMLPTNLNNFEVQGKGNSDFLSEYQKSGIISDSNLINPPTLGNPFGSNMDLRGNPKMKLQKEEYAWFDANHPKYKNDPLYQSALKAVLKKYPKDSEIWTNLNSPNQQVREKAQKDYLGDLSNAYNTLSNPQSYDRRMYQMSPERSKDLATSAWNLRNNIRVREVDENGRVSSEEQSLNKVWDSDNATKDINSGKVSIEGHSFPLSTGVSGTVMTVDGKRYITDWMTDPALKTIMDQESRLANALLRDGAVIKGVDLPYISNNKVTLKNNVIFSPDYKQAETIIEVYDEATGNKIGDVPRQEFIGLSDAWHRNFNPYAKTKKTKEKNVQFIENSSMIEEN